MWLVFLFIGCVIGAGGMYLVDNFFRTSHGWFMIEPHSAEDPDFYNVRVSINTTDRKLPRATRIILHRYNSQK